MRWIKSNIWCIEMGIGVIIALVFADRELFNQLRRLSVVNDFSIYLIFIAILIGLLGSFFLITMTIRWAFIKKPVNEAQNENQIGSRHVWSNLGSILLRSGAFILAITLFFFIIFSSEDIFGSYAKEVDKRLNKHARENVTIAIAFDEGLKNHVENLKTALNNLNHDGRMPKLYFKEHSIKDILTQYFKMEEDSCDAIVRLIYTTKAEDSVEYNVILNSRFVEHSGFMEDSKTFANDQNLFTMILHKHATLATFIKVADLITGQNYREANREASKFIEAFSNDTAMISTDLAAIKYLLGKNITSEAWEKSRQFNSEEKEQFYRSSIKPFDEALMLDPDNTIYRNSAALWRFYSVNYDIFKEKNIEIRGNDFTDWNIYYGKRIRRKQRLLVDVIEMYYLLKEGCEMRKKGYLRSVKLKDGKITQEGYKDPVVEEGVKIFKDEGPRFIRYINSEVNINLDDPLLIKDFEDDLKINNHESNN